MVGAVRVNGPNREILRLSIPAIVSNITVPLLGLCDTGIAGHLGSEVYLASIAVGSVMMNVVFWLFGFLRAGTTGLSAEAFGSGNSREIAKVFTRAIAIGLFAGGIIILSKSFLCSLLLKVVEAPQDIIPTVREYFNLCILGAPAILATAAILGWFIGLQNTFYPMIISISVNLINIAVSFILVFLFDFGFIGIATGTVVANWLGLLLAAGCCLHYNGGKIPLCGIKELFEGGLKRYFSVNIYLFFRSFCIIAVTLGMTSMAAALGTFALAVNVVAMQLFQFYSYFMDGYAFAGEALIGRYKGEGNMTGLKRAVKYLLLWTLSLGLIFSSCYFWGLNDIASILTDNKEVINMIGGLCVILGIMPVAAGWAFIFDGFYIGLALTGRMFVSTFSASLLFFVLLGLMRYSQLNFLPSFSISTLWTAFICYLLIRGIVLIGWWNGSLRKSFGNID